MHFDITISRADISKYIDMSDVPVGRTYRTWIFFFQATYFILEVNKNKKFVFYKNPI